MVQLIDIFDVWYGVNLEVVNCAVTEKEIPFVSRQSINNGIVCHVKRIDGIEPNPSFTLSIAVSGSVLSTFFHDYEYYSGRDVYVASPKIPLTKEEMLFYACVIEKNKYRYNYGRGANRTFRDILIPSYDEIPQYVKTFNVNYEFDMTPVTSMLISLSDREWKDFRFDDIFIIKKGFYNKKPENEANGEIPFIGATDSNNGITSRCSLEQIEQTTKTGDEKNAPIDEKIFKSNCITVSNNGSVGYAFYQPIEFTCTHDVNPLYLHPKWGINMNPNIALFLCTIIEKERFRWTYGRKWRPKRMPSSIIRLPVVAKTNTPDWQFMEDYIKSLPYSKNI